jgi:hypothetical protein
MTMQCISQPSQFGLKYAVASNTSREKKKSNSRMVGENVTVLDIHIGLGIDRAQEVMNR